MERKETDHSRILMDEVVSLCQRYLQEGIDMLQLDEDTIVSIAEGHGTSLYSQARMIVDIIKKPISTANRVKGYVIFPDRVMNHPGPANAGETFPVHIDELNQLVEIMRTSKPI